MVPFCAIRALQCSVALRIDPISDDRRSGIEFRSHSVVRCKADDESIVEQPLEPASDLLIRTENQRTDVLSLKKPVSVDGRKDFQVP